MNMLKAIKDAKPGSLRFLGDWFGKPYDNFHRIVNCDFSVESPSLILYFDHGEVCKITDPNGIRIENGLFRIEKASKIIWQWYYYGPDPCLETICLLEYTYLNASRVHLTSCGKMQMDSQDFHPNDHFAMEIL